MNAPTVAAMPEATVADAGPMPSLALLQGSVDYFAALIDDIEQASQRVWLETYIFDFTGSSSDVATALMAAARRGVQVRLLVDGIGTGPMPADWQQRFAEAGVHWLAFSPPGFAGLLNPVRWRRLHRKLAVVDGDAAYCGGINVLDDFHDPNHGRLEQPRYDFGVRVCGLPVVAEIAAAMDQLWQRIQRLRDTVQAARQREFRLLLGSAQGSIKALMPRRENPLNATNIIAARADPAGTILLLRDNFRHRTRIEKAYRRAIATARHEVIIANAYFMPGLKLRRALVRAARRGVRVRLLLQGRYEYFMQYHAAKPVYGTLLAAGVEIHEYEASFLHAKVAVVDAGSDRCWSTVGSSNLDPLSLLLAREANLEIHDAVFAALLRDRLEHAFANGGRAVDAASYLARPRYQRALNWLAYGLMRFALFVTGKRY